jgi:drug/metabolite transporter (DMT)-like permease
MRRNYLYKVWGSTIVAAPILMMLATAMIAAKQGSGFDAGAFGFIAFAIGYGLVLSLPTFLIVYFIFPVLSKKPQRPLKLKVSMLLIGVACVLATFYLLYSGDAYNPNGNYAALTFSVAYSICLVVFSFTYKFADNEAQHIT